MYSKQYILSTLENIKQKYVDIGIQIVGVFGSVARGEASESSDIDVLYKTKKGVKNLYDKKLLLREELQKLFNTKVDLANERYLKPYAKETVMKDLVYV